MSGIDRGVRRLRKHRLHRALTASAGAALALGAISLPACERAQRASDAARVRVVASVLPHADIVRRIGGDHVEVTVLVPPGAFPDTHEPSVAALQALERADCFIAVGHPSFPLERRWFARLVRENERLVVVDGSRGAPHRDGDPHVWLSIAAVVTLAHDVRDALVERRPAARRDVDAALVQFLETVDELDAAFRAATAGHEGEAVLVFHPAWGYLLEHYGLRQVAIEHEGKEPGAAHVARVVDQARVAGARVIFVQPQQPHEIARVVAREVGARVETLDPLPADWVEGMRRVADALGRVLGS